MVKTKVKKKEPQEVQKKTVTEKTPSESTDVNSNSNLLMPLVLLLLLVVLVLQVVILFSSSESSNDVNLDELSEINEKITRVDNFFSQNIEGYGSGNAQEELNPEDFPTVQKPTIDNRPMLGEASAPITIVEYSDFECPFCQRFFQTTYPTLKNYVEAGTANLVFKDFPLSFHALAEPSAIASKCVFRELGDEAFFEYHDVLFENQGILSIENFKVWAEELGMDSTVYDECIVDSTIKAQVQADFVEGQQIGVSGTPSVVINDKLVVGACPAQTFEQAIALELEGIPFFVEECQVITA